jgi:hypothetical protein
MKKLILAATVVLAAQSLYAQSTNTTSMSQPTMGATSVNGVNLSISKPVLDIKLSGGGASDTKDMEDVLAFSAGYKNINVGSIGVLAGGSLISGKVEDTSGSWTFLRAEGNATFGLNELVFLKGGLNISKLIDGPNDTEKFIDSVGVGVQAGLGLQFTRNVALDLQYVNMKQTGDVQGTSIDLKEKGFEVGVSATF